MIPGAVRLRVGDLERCSAFYETEIGLSRVEGSSGAEGFGVAGGPPLVELVGDPDAPPRPPRSTGLFHLAILLPDRVGLARTLRRLIESGSRITGASDHLVSEALYLSDPDGNGIEIYRDRPREEWRYADGQIEMATLPLDLDGLLAEAPAGEEVAAGMPAGTRIGHIHLQVAELVEVRRFYEQLLGFEVTVETYPGALFVASGGYHHHVGLNTWASEGGSPPPPGSRGLRWFELTGPGDEIEAVAKRLDEAGLTAELTELGLTTTDPSGNPILLKGASE